MTRLREWDFGSGAQPRELAPLSRLDARLDAAYNIATGHDSWDDRGRFLFTSFGGEGQPSTPHVLLLRVHPVRLKASLGLSPGVPLLQLVASELVRTGELSAPLSVILTITPAGRPPQQRTLEIPAGTSRVPLPADIPAGARVHIVPDGDTYSVPERRF